MKKIVGISAIIIILILLVGAWLIFGPATKFSNNSRYLYVRDGSSAQEQIIHQLDTGNIIRNQSIFNIIAKQAKAWQRITPGRFEIKKGENIFSVVRTLRNNHQSPVRLVINKLRLREDLSRAIGKNFSTDSVTALQFLSNNDSLTRLGVDTNTLMILIIPDTYFLNWNTSPEKILLRLKDEQEKFWNKNDRLQKAAALN